MFRKLSNETERLSSYDYIKALDPVDGFYNEFRIVGTYIDHNPHSEGLRLQRENGSIFQAPNWTLQTESKRKITGDHKFNEYLKPANTIN